MSMMPWFLRLACVVRAFSMQQGCDLAREEEGAISWEMNVPVLSMINVENRVAAS